MILAIIIGFEDGVATTGSVVQANNDRDAVRKALDWVAGQPLDGWQVFEYLPHWGPGREIKPIDSDYR